MSYWNNDEIRQRSQWEQPKPKDHRTTTQPGNIHSQLRANIDSIKSRSVMLAQAKSSVLSGFISSIAVSNKDKNVQMVYDPYNTIPSDDAIYESTPRFRSEEKKKYRPTEPKTIPQDNKKNANKNIYNKPPRSNKSVSRERKTKSISREKKANTPKKHTSYTDIDKKKIKKEQKWKELLNFTENSLKSNTLPTKVLITHTMIIPDQEHQEICLQENVTVKRWIPFKDVNSEFIMHLAEMETKKAFVKENVLQLDTVDSDRGIGFVKKRMSDEGMCDVSRIPYVNKSNVLRRVESSPSHAYGFDLIKTGGFDFQDKMKELALKQDIYLVKHLIFPPLLRAEVEELDQPKIAWHNPGFRQPSPIFGKIFKETNDSGFYDWPNRPSIFRGLVPRNSPSSMPSNQAHKKPDVIKKSSLIFTRSIESITSDDYDDDVNDNIVEIVEPVETSPKSLVTIHPPVERVEDTSVNKDIKLISEDEDFKDIERIEVTTVHPPVELKPIERAEDTRKASLLARTNVSFEVDQFDNSLRLNHHIMALKRAEVRDRKDMYREKIINSPPDSTSKGKNFFLNLFKRKRNSKKNP